jgi:hypothetical protein
LKDLIKAIDNFFNAMNKHEEFFIYKSLSILTSHQNEKILLSLIRAINENNKGKWISRILSYLKIKKNKNEELRLLALFLNKLSTQKPDFIIELLERNTNELKPYLTDILDGLLNSQQRKKAILQINTWINDGKYLIECAKLDLNISLINQIFDKLLKSNNVEALNHLVNSVLWQYTKKNNLIKKFFSPAIKLLNKEQDFEWWISFGRYNFNEIIANLEEDEVDILVDSLLNIPNIEDFHEGIIKVLAEQFPNKIISFFYDRIIISETINDNSYTPIPNSFYCLRDVFLNFPEEFIEIYKKLYVLGGKNVYWGGQLITNIFGITNVVKMDRLNLAFEDMLVGLIKNNDDQHISMVMNLLKNFPWCLINNLCKELVKVLPNDKKYMSEIRVLLGFTGILIGDYGFTENYKELKNEMEKWKDDENEKVQSFANKLIKELIDINIPKETRIADKRVNS